MAFQIGRILVAAALAVTFADSAAAAAPAEGEIRSAGGPTAVAGSYIVVLNGAVADRPTALTRRYGGSVVRTYRHALQGFEVNLPEAAARRLAADPAVSYVEQNHRVHKLDTQSPVPSWGLDRIDERNLVLDNSFTYPVTATGVRAYIIDTGIRFSHSTYGGRAVSGFDAVDGGSADDCDGHGTHVAGTVGGSQYGVAKGVTLVAVRVLDCSGSGTWAGVISGIDWVTGDHDPGELAVANMSLGGGVNQSVNNAVANSIADGVTYAVAAGNENTDACTRSPASTPSAITVAATGGQQGSTGRSDARASFSNYGTCVDIFAPGVYITSSTMDSNTSSAAWDGTSMATPHVAGAAALVLAQNPSFTPQQVRDYLVTNGTTGVVTSPGSGSPNVLLYVVNAPPPANDFSVVVSPANGSTEPGGSVTATVGTTVTNGSAQSVNLSASGLPSGTTASFTPPTINSGEAAAIAISTSGSTPAGTYPVTITGTGTFATRTATFTLTVTGPPGCAGSNPADVAIPDLSTVESSITISGCPGNAGSGSTVEVHIVHTYIGDLVVSLIAPDGSTYVLHNREGGGTDNIDQTYAVNLSSEPANGTWRLRVADQAQIDTGYVNSWTLTLTGTGTGPCTGANPTDVSITDLSTVESAIPLSGCTGNASGLSTVEVHIVHTYIGDLVVTLVAPDGSTYVLHNREGGSADNIDQTYTVDLSSEARNGTWRLRVSDEAQLDTGYLNSWTLTL